MIGRNIAPGLTRSSYRAVRVHTKELLGGYKEARKNSITKDFRILASDIDGRVINTARGNAKKAGVEEKHSFQEAGRQGILKQQKCGYIITNPPYGDRG